jgi:hypothetical protein
MNLTIISFVYSPTPSSKANHKSNSGVNEEDMKSQINWKIILINEVYSLLIYFNTCLTNTTFLNWEIASKHIHVGLEATLAQSLQYTG